MGSEEAYWKYWGKARKKGEAGAPYHLLACHCLDVAAVGAVYLERHPTLRRHLAGHLGLSQKLFSQWLTFSLAMHDLGKFAAAFQCLVPEARLALTGKADADKKGYGLRHDSLGYLLWCDHFSFMFEKDGFLGMAPKSRALRNGLDPFFDGWMRLVTGHHGEPPKTHNGDRRWTLAEFYTDADLAAASEFWSDCLSLLIPDAAALAPLLEDKAFAKRIRALSWPLAGLAVMCDWIGSNRRIFEYRSEAMPLEIYWRKFALPQAEQALSQAAVLPTAVAPYQGIGSLFGYIAAPTPLQSLCDRAEIGPDPQLWILEDVTGSGKTEAALILVQRLMSLGLADGLYIGLPTMATANAMYGRMAEHYRKLYNPEGHPSLVLAHSARHLSKLFHDSILAQDGDGLSYAGQPSASAQCAAWLADNSKKALLADVGVGTLDQALLAVLPARHQSLRMFGLSRKVLLVDEVHAYDDYMHRLLQEVLKGHARLGGSAILLSATLPSRSRQQLIDAFYEGLEGKDAPSPAIAPNSPYPLATRLTRHALTESGLKTRREVRRALKLEFIEQQTQVLELIRTAARQGRCVCWIRNTVEDVRKAYDELSAMGEIPTEKLAQFHSRFALKDRLDREGEVLTWFGSESRPVDRQARILVASQVVEQSLDIDLDVMISDLAPVDLLIQRAGRLHRHRRNALGERLSPGQTKDQRPRPVFHIHAPPFTEAPEADWYKAVFPKAHWVYPNTAQLWLTYKALRQRGLLRMANGSR